MIQPKVTCKQKKLIYFKEFISNFEYWYFCLHSMSYKNMGNTSSFSCVLSTNIMSHIEYSVSPQWAQRHVALSTGKWNPFSGSGQAATCCRHSKWSNVLTYTTPNELQIREGKSAAITISYHWHHFKSMKTLYLLWTQCESLF